MKKRKVALIGTNLVMSTVAASLQQSPEFQVQEIKGKSSDIIDKLEAAPPEVILFDLSAAQPDFAVPLLLDIYHQAFQDGILYCYSLVD